MLTIITYIGNLNLVNKLSLLRPEGGKSFKKSKKLVFPKSIHFFDDGDFAATHLFVAATHIFVAATHL